MTTRKLDLSQFEEFLPSVSNYSPVDVTEHYVDLLAECKRQREQIAKLRAALRALRGAAVLAEASAFAVPPFVVAMVTYE